MFSKSVSSEDLLRLDPAQCSGTLCIGFRHIPFSFASTATAHPDHPENGVQSVLSQCRYLTSLLDSVCASPVALTRTLERSTVRLGERKEMSLSDLRSAIYDPEHRVMPMNERISQSISLATANITTADARETLNHQFVNILTHTKSLETLYLLMDNPHALEHHHNWLKEPSRNISVFNVDAPCGSAPIGHDAVVSVFGKEARSPQGFMQMISHITPTSRKHIQAVVSRGMDVSDALHREQVLAGRALFESMDAYNFLSQQVTTGKNAPGWENALLSYDDIQTLNKATERVHEQASPDQKADAMIDLMAELGKRHLTAEHSSSLSPM